MSHLCSQTADEAEVPCQEANNPRGTTGHFYAKRNKAHISNGTVASPANQDGTEQVDAFSYENVLPVVAPARNGRRLLQKGKLLPNTINIEDEEDYECPDSETEHKSDDDENYENTQEEVKQGEMVLKDASLYENNNSKVKSGFHNWGSANGENYENLEEEPPVNPGAIRLIAALSQLVLLFPDSGSQSYEEMNGSLSHTATKPLHLHPNTSNEEDADSYENMESPNGFNSRHEGSLDACGEGMPFGSPWQHQSIPLNFDLRGGRLCSD
ncbi:hypothetical protein JD844_001620 [Phrynosoma platyrhinos]|uniref:Uncharacterized protein n=1 Tax=Phrynosoma platyrhinos TaxID=52577 RepID=A0ABQ7TA04_PHRPL|nr:hypothetical protein JD844_001620 [Phrynosoma platyrhinos]